MNMQANFHLFKKRSDRINTMAATGIFAFCAFASSLSVSTTAHAANAVSTNRLQVFVRGTDNCLYGKSLDQSSWAWDAWTNFEKVPVPCDMASAPSVASISTWGKKQVHVIYRRNDNHIIDARYDGSNWGVHDIGGLTNHAPTVVNVQDGQFGGHLALYYRGVDNYMWVNTLGAFDGIDNWAGEHQMPVAQNNMGSGPSATTLVVNGNTYIQLVYRRANDGGIGHAWQHVKNSNGDTVNAYAPTSGWSEDSLGGVTYSTPSAVAWQGGGYYVFHRGTDNRLWVRTWWPNSGWGGWQQLGSGVAADVQSGVSATVIPNRFNNRPQMHVFWRDSNKNIGHQWYETNWNTDTIGCCTNDTPGAMNYYSPYQP